MRSRSLLPDSGCCQTAARHGLVAAARRALARLVALLLAALLLGACGSLPTGVERVPSAALAPAVDSPLVQIARASTPSAEQSGFRLMPIGAYSLDARLQMVRRAVHSLDVQYYVIEDDPTGRLFFSELRDAALRGVRVRLLLDDLYTAPIDALLRSLAAYPNVQVRLFNPFCCARASGVPTRFVASAFDARRVNRRMHNKLLLADGVMAVAGGRNIGDQYFLRSTEQNFIDMDAFMMGAVVADLAAIFDRYWNSPVVYPIAALEGATGDAPPAGGDTARRAAFVRQVDEAPMRSMAGALAPVDVLGYGPIGEELDGGRIGLVWGVARAFADPPEKALERDHDENIRNSVAYDVLMTLWQARSELVITSPYLIPGPKGMEAIQSLARRGVKVTIMTNSLAATDVPLVHAGYARYRLDLLRLGVDLYELSPTRTQRATRLGVFGSSLGRLHSKTAVVDRSRVFIGSMNLDPRSAGVNTELGIFVDSPELARELLRVVNISKLQSAYRLRLGPDGAIEWLTDDDEHEVVLHEEPEAPLLLRLNNMLSGLFVPEQLL